MEIPNLSAWVYRIASFRYWSRIDMKLLRYNHFSYSDGNNGMADPTAKEMLKGETFRIGAEWKVIPQFAFRLGYDYMSAAFKKQLLKI